MKHQPKPLIEQHYYIQELIDAQQKRVDDREYHRNLIKDKEERNNLIKDSPVMSLTDFWCRKCLLDFKSMSVREVEIDWTSPLQNIAFYRTKCDKGHWCIRHITDKWSDPFWNNSETVLRDRGKHFKDIIQPFETGYNLLYEKR